MVPSHCLHWEDMHVDVSLQGGAIQRFERSGQPLMCLASTAPYLASFAMLPFCSRIHNGRFRYGDHDVSLAPNFPPEPHAIHGFGWQGLWRLEPQSDYACALVYEHDGPASAATGWPWLFRATQHIALSDLGLSLTLTLENFSKDAMPAGMGLHPHFPLAEDTRVSMSCAARVVMNDDFLPETVQLGDTGEANPLANRPWLSRGMDDVFAHRNGRAQIIWPGQPCSLAIEPDAELAHWIVFAPRAKRFICIEPISHLPNAVNMKPANAPLTGAVKVLAPGQGWTTKTSFVTYATAQSVLHAPSTSC